MGVLNSMTAGSSTSTPVVTIVWKSACGTGTIGVGNVAVVAVGRMRPMAPRATTAPKARPIPPRRSDDRRSTAATTTHASTGRASNATMGLGNADLGHGVGRRLG
jgi:hypothetical protein